MDSKELISNVMESFMCYVRALMEKIMLTVEQLISKINGTCELTSIIRYKTKRLYLDLKTRYYKHQYIIRLELLRNYIRKGEI